MFQNEIHVQLVVFEGWWISERILQEEDHEGSSNNCLIFHKQTVQGHAVGRGVVGRLLLKNKFEVCQ